MEDNLRHEHQKSTSDNLPKRSFFGSLKQGLAKTSHKVASGLSSLIAQKPLNDHILEEIEALLLGADLGPSTTTSLLTSLKKRRYAQNTSSPEIQEILAEQLETILRPYEKELPRPSLPAPFVILMVGINGSGKTTTTAKLAAYWRDLGHNPLLVAADTFRAGAIQQLHLWAKKRGFAFFTKQGEKDSASLCYEGVLYAKQNGHDVVLLDTAGRLHTNTNLMEELSKIVRVLKKADPSAPHLTLLVLDGTLGQNTHQHLKVFQEKIPIDGLIITKLDGTSKGGILVGLCTTFDKPVFAIGCGETDEDLIPFNAHSYARALVGL